jgi:hypothetical protein
MMEGIPTEMPKRQPEVTVKKAHNGGYIVTNHSKNYGPSEDMVFSKLSGVMKCLKECFHDEEAESE